MATRLKKLRINRIDLVDKGAAPDARIALYKRAPEPVGKNDEYDHGDYTPQTVEQILAQRDAKEAWWELTGALEMSVRSIMECADPSEAADLLTQTVNEFSTRAKKLLPQMTVMKGLAEAVDEVEKAGRVIAANRLGRLKDAIAVLTQIIREAEPAKEDDDMADADVAKRAEEAEARVKTLEAEVAKAQDVTKRLEAAEARAQAAEDVAKRNQDRLEEREYIEKAQRYTALPVKAEEDWRVLKAIDGLEPSVRDRALELLGAAEGQLALAGALGAVGKGGERRGGGSAYAELDTLAKAAVVKGMAKDYDAGFSQVLRERPDLYERHRRESLDKT
jgi:hypothetical protein